jgi:hypothetical protein
MYLDRKLTVAAMAALAISASIAFAQSQIQRAPVTTAQASQGSFGELNDTPVQKCLMALISWEQQIALEQLGGSFNWEGLSEQTKDARMEVVRACNLYHRATLTEKQQTWYDGAILDPKGHPLPSKWEEMRKKGTLVKALLISPEGQQAKASEVLQRFQDRNSADWGHGFKNGAYKRNHDLLVKEFRAILNPEQLKEFDGLWAKYTGLVKGIVKSGPA